MTTMQCPHCGGEIQNEKGQPARFCPYCGKTLQTGQGPSPLEQRLGAERKPKKKHQIIQEVLAQNPDDLEANRALLFHGRLHEPMARGRDLDFSIIKCHLLSVFHTPEKYAPEILAAKYEELLRGPQLRRTMALSPDPDAFFAEYIDRLAYEYVDLFVRGDSKYSAVAFGIGRTPDSLARKCAEPVRDMLAEIERTDRLSETERALLRGAVRTAYARVFMGREQYLDG
ncbi:zinc ribbon domain-containing protein [Eubacteriales bacterium OttesenSCG-928-A19]|nr:zinc ribbon domain-containing protein [Eubacteriales bacterium OttesenSCG-928-A19]